MSLLLFFAGADSGAPPPTPVIAVPIQHFHIGTFFESHNVSIIAKQPLWIGTGLIDDQIASKIDAYSHEKAADGGYISANFTFASDFPELESWFADGIGRHIEIYNEALVKIFEGFVNAVDIAVGSFRAKRGPLMNVTNKLRSVYQTMSYNVVPPIGGNRDEYPANGVYLSDTTSQTRYSILETILSAGQGTSTQVAQIVDTYLAENKNPETTQTLNIGANAKPTVSVEVRGYRDYLTRYYYSSSISSTMDADNKIEDVLNTDPNNFFTDFTGLTANSLQVPQFEEGENKADSIIRDVVVRGDSSDNRWVFGIYNDRKAIYEPVETAISYYHKLGDPGQWIETTTGARLFPWNIQAGKWLFITDFLAGKNPSTPLAEDPRAIYIESIRYTAPWGLEINGGKVSKVAQQLAKMGLGGI